MTNRKSIRTGARLLEQGEYELALQEADRALALDPLPPVLHYLKAQCLEALDRSLEAEAAYAQSRENMVGHLGGRLSINEIIRRRAEANGVEIIDVRKIFDDFEHSRGRRFNEDLIHDDCHPTPLGHQLITRSLLPFFEVAVDEPLPAP